MNGEQGDGSLPIGSRSGDKVSPKLAGDEGPHDKVPQEKPDEGSQVERPWNKLADVIDDSKVTTPGKVPGEPPRIHPDALREMSFSERAAEYQTGKLFSELTKNIRNEGIKIKWTEYMDLMDSIANVNAEPQDNGFTTLKMEFADPTERKNVAALLNKLLHGADEPLLSILPGEDKFNELIIENFGHEDLATLGRVGTALFLDQYGEKLQQNIRLIRQRSLQDIEQYALDDLLPYEIAQRLTTQKEALGGVLGDEEAGKRLLTSGIGISRMGNAVRGASKADRGWMLERKNSLERAFGKEWREKEEATLQLPMQRPKGKRPKIEENLNFIYSQQSKDLPVSGTTLGQDVRNTAQQRVAHELPSTFGEGAQTFINLATGGIGLDVFLTGGRIGANIGKSWVQGIGGALAGFLEDRGTERLMDGGFSNQSWQDDWERKSEEEKRKKLAKREEKAKKNSRRATKRIIDHIQGTTPEQGDPLVLKAYDKGGK